MPIEISTSKDIPELVALLNNTYRGEASRRGWTSEADLLEGDLRTDKASLKQLLKQPEAVFLKYVNDNDKIEGCVFLHKKGARLYLGMLSVSPLMQAKGVGKQLMAAATGHAKEQNCSSIFMKVISVRQELIAWYERQGYVRTSETEPFPTDNRFGIPTQPLEFIIMEKTII